MYPGWLAGPRARRLRRYAFSLTFFGSIAVEAGREAAIRFFPRVMSATFSIPFYPLSTVHWIAMSSTQGFDRPTDVLVPGVLGFHDELYSGIRSTDVIYLSLCWLTCFSPRVPAVPRPPDMWFLGRRALDPPRPDIIGYIVTWCYMVYLFL